MKTKVKAKTPTKPKPKSKGTRVGKPKRASQRAPKTGQMERTKSNVLDSTIELLDEMVYAKLTIDVISERSGVSRSSIYRYWKSLPEIVSEAFDRAVGPDPQIDLDNDLRSNLIEIFSNLPRDLDETTWGHVLPSLIAASNSDDDFSGRLQKISDRRRRGLRRYLKMFIDRGELKPDTNIEWVIDAISSTFYTRHLITGTYKRESGHVEWLVDNVLKTILTRPSKYYKKR